MGDRHMSAEDRRPAAPRECDDLTYVVTTSRRYDPRLAELAMGWAERLDARFVPRAERSLQALCGEEGVDAVLTVTAERVSLIIPAEDVKYFFHPSMARVRIRNLIEGMGDPMVTAMGLAEGDRVLDCTLGRATDATVASWVVGEEGRVVGYEAHPLVAALTIDGLEHYEIAGRGVQEAMRRIDAREGDCARVLPTLETGSFDVVYFDPFFEHALERSQAMRPLRRIGVHDRIVTDTFAQARRVARRCVVIKQGSEERFADLPGVEDVVAGGGSRVEYVLLSAAKRRDV